MRVRWRLGALVLAVGALLGAATAPCALACSCAGPITLREAVEPRSAVVVGRVGAPVAGRYPFTVERWFAGPQPTAVLTLQGAEQVFSDGTTTINTCGRTFAANQRLILVGEQTGNELATSICGLGADADSPEGRALIAEAESRYGPGLAPDAPEDPIGGPGPTGGDGGWIPVILLGSSGVALAALAIVAAVLLVRRRQA